MMVIKLSESTCHATPIRWLLAFGILSLSNLGADELTLKLRDHPELTLKNGIVGNNYSVQYNSNLAQPGSWQTFTNLALESSSNTWVDASANTNASRFYRARLAILQSFNPPPAPHTAMDLASTRRFGSCWINRCPAFRWACPEPG